MLESPELEFIMEAHNGLSAKIVQEAGVFSGNISISLCWEKIQSFSQLFPDMRI